MRLIDADSIVLDYGGLAKISPYDFQGIAEYFLKQIRRLPTVDAVPVVRCKDCVDFVKGKDKMGEIRYCNLNSIYGCDENSFCSFGRKKR